MVLIIKRMKKGVGSIIVLDHYQTVICLIMFYNLRPVFELPI